MAAKRKHRSTNEYLKYLKGELTPEERYSFERELEADPFEMEAMDGMGNLSESELEEDLLSLHANLQKRLNRRRRRNWYYAAATVASLLIVGTVFLNIYEIDPKISSESIPADESMFYEDAAPESDVLERDIAEREQDIVEAGPMEAEAEPMKTVEEALPDKELEEKVLDDRPMELDVEAPAQVAEEVVDQEVVDQEVVDQEVVAVEAQPLRSQKKGRAAETPKEVPMEAQVEVPSEAAGEAVRVAAREAPVQAPAEAQLEATASYTAGRVSGIVVSAEDMEPLPGASIVVKGSDSGMVADMEGRFAFVSAKQEPETVIASYLGMETEEYQLDGGLENRVVMQPDMTILNEVLVVGYEKGVMAYPTGAVQKVQLKPEEFSYSGAEPEGGLEAFKMYIEEQIRFPAGDTLSKREVVVLKFNVDRDGSISNIQTLRSPGILFTEEAIRLLQEGPVWKPAQNENGSTEDVVRMRIVFKQ